MPDAYVTPPQRRGEVPEAAIEVRCAVVELRAADVRADLQRVARPARGGDVVDELVIELVAIDRIGARIADDVTGRDARPAHDRRVVAREDVDVRAALSEAVATFLHRRAAEDVRPGDAEVRLVVVLQRLLADDQLLVFAQLRAVLIARVHRVARARVPVETRGVVAVGLVRELRVLIPAALPGRFGDTPEGKRARIESCHARFAAVSLLSVSRGSAMSAGKNQRTADGQVALELRHVVVDEGEQLVLDDRESRGRTALPAVVVRISPDVGLGISFLVPLGVLRVAVHLARDLVRAGLRLHEHDRAVAAAELRAVAVRQNLERLDRRQRHALAVLVLRRVVVVHAVDLERRAARSGAVEVRRRAGRERRVVHAAGRILPDSRPASRPVRGSWSDSPAAGS